MRFVRRLRAAWAVLFGTVKAPGLDVYYAREQLAPWRGGQSISPAKPLSVPAVWRSSPDHVIAYLAYISAEEAQLLAAIDLHGSGVSEKMHFGPLAIPSYQGDGDSSAGGEGPSGPGDDEESDPDDDAAARDGLEGDPNVGFDTPASIMAEANYGLDAVNGEFQGLEGPADPGPTGASLGEPPPAAVVEPPRAQVQETTSAILNSILTAPPVPEMPMPENSSARLARRRSVREQSRRRGRTSTILSNLDPLGG